jgi:hypothetical protein
MAIKVCFPILLAAVLPTVALVRPSALLVRKSDVDPRVLRLESPAAGLATAPPQLLDPSTRQFTDEKLPDTTDGLLAELNQRRKDVESLLKQGGFASIWLPAIRAKDLALDLEEKHLHDVSDRRRPLVTSAVKRLTVIAWQLDSAGDLGNREKLTDLYTLFSAAVDDIESIYASPR